LAASSVISRPLVTLKGFDFHGDWRVDNKERKVLGVHLLTDAHGTRWFEAHMAEAQKAIDKVTGDLQGMDKMMAKSEMSQIHGLVGQAERYRKAAQQDCKPTNTPYVQAQAIARATAANGYATAADVLHFHYMEETGSGGTKTGGNMGDMKGMGGMKGMSNMPGMGTAPSK
jgi:hypothetical protein